MASTPSKTETGATESSVVSLDDFGRDVERRRETFGKIDLPRNAGTRRTASKRALLKAIEDAGGNW